MLEHIGVENAVFVTILFLLGRFYLICYLEYHSCTSFEIEQQWCIVQRASQLDNDWNLERWKRFMIPNP